MEEKKIIGVVGEKHRDTLILKRDWSGGFSNYEISLVSRSGAIDRPSSNR